MPTSEDPMIDVWFHPCGDSYAMRRSRLIELLGTEPTSNPVLSSDHCDYCSAIADVAAKVPWLLKIEHEARVAATN